MDPVGARDWAEAELRRDPNAEDRLPDALFGGASDYPIPPTYAEIDSAERFRLRADDDPSMPVTPIKGSEAVCDALKAPGANLSGDKPIPRPLFLLGREARVADDGE